MDRTLYYYKGLSPNVYVIELDGKFKTVNIEKLKKAIPRISFLNNTPINFNNNNVGPITFNGGSNSNSKNIYSSIETSVDSPIKSTIGMINDKPQIISSKTRRLSNAQQKSLNIVNDALRKSLPNSNVANNDDSFKVPSSPYRKSLHNPTATTPSILNTNKSSSSDDDDVTSPPTQQKLQIRPHSPKDRFTTIRKMPLLSPPTTKNIMTRTKALKSKAPTKIIQTSVRDRMNSYSKSISIAQTNARSNPNAPRTTRSQTKRNDSNK